VPREPKRLILYPGANHGLDEVAATVQHTIREWIITQLARARWGRSIPPKSALAQWDYGP
jgi:hypothetical protein